METYQAPFQTGFMTLLIVFGYVVCANVLDMTENRINMCNEDNFENKKSENTEVKKLALSYCYAKSYSKRKLSGKT